MVLTEYDYVIREKGKPRDSSPNLLFKQLSSSVSRLEYLWTQRREEHLCVTSPEDLTVQPDKGSSLAFDLPFLVTYISGFRLGCAIVFSCRGEDISAFAFFARLHKMSTSSAVHISSQHKNSLPESKFSGSIVFPATFSDIPLFLCEKRLARREEKHKPHCVKTQ